MTLYRGLPYELPLGVEPLLRGLLDPGSGRPRCPRTAATRSPTTTCARATTRSACSTRSRPTRSSRPPPRRRRRRVAQAGGGRRGRQFRGRRRPAATPARSGGDRDVRRRSGRRRQRQLSARNRELLALVPVAVIVAAGFAAVFIVHDNEVSDVSLTYARLLPRPLPRRPHLPAHPAPVRRPLPVPALRAARRDRARRHLPDRRRARLRPGVGVRARPRPLLPHDPLPARLPRARALPLPDRDASGSCCCWRRSSPATRSTAPT